MLQSLKIAPGYPEARPNVVTTQLRIPHLTEVRVDDIRPQITSFIDKLIRTHEEVNTVYLGSRTYRIEETKAYKSLVKTLSFHEKLHTLFFDQTYIIFDLIWVDLEI